LIYDRTGGILEAGKKNALLFQVCGDKRNRAQEHGRGEGLGGGSKGKLGEGGRRRSIRFKRV